MTEERASTDCFLLLDRLIGDDYSLRMIMSMIQNQTLIITMRIMIVVFIEF